MAGIGGRVTSTDLISVFVLAVGSLGCRESGRIEPSEPARAIANPPPVEASVPSLPETPANPPIEQPATGEAAIGVDQVGTYGTGKPSPFGSRKLAQGPIKGTQVGPTQRTEKAVLDGLRWLARHQNADGSWGAVSMRSHCPAGAPCYDAKLESKEWFDVGLTALAVLCFLDAGFTHESKQDLVDLVKGERHRIGDIVKRGLNWLHDRQKSDGSFTPDRPFMYNEALATMALAKAFELTHDLSWKVPAQKGINLVEAAQRANPSLAGLWGWRYEARRELQEHFGDQVHGSDTSVTSWCVMALEAGRLAGLEIQPESLQGAMEFCKSVTADGGLVGYMDAKTAGATVTGPFSDQFTYHPTTMSALGMCLRIFATHDADDPFLSVAAKRIVQDLPTVSKDHASIDYYYWHCGSLALNQFDGPDSAKQTGKYWKPWSKAMVDALLSLQDHTQQACSNGGWILSDRWGNYSGAGPLFNTAMNVLTLETFYAYPNSFGIHALIGAPAPDLRVIDEKGAPIQLTECRGAVVLLDFWKPEEGDFDECIESRRSLAKRLEERPFLLLTLPLHSESNPDEEQHLPDAEVRKFSCWRCSQPLPTDDPIRTKFMLGRSPTLVVIDAAGTVRAAVRTWESAVDMVDRVLAEVGGSAKPK